MNKKAASNLAGAAPPADVRLSVRVTPRASRDELVRAADGSLGLRLTAPPVDGAANAACCAFLADFFGVAKFRVSVVSGHKSRSKVVEIEGLTWEAAQTALARTAASK